MSENVRHLPPRGHYLAYDAGRLAGVSGNTIGQWARRGYIRSSQSSDIPRVYSYQDVAEAMVVHELLERGIRHQAIKQTVQRLRSRYGHDWPLTRARLGTAGGSVVAEDEGVTYDVGGDSWQQIHAEDLVQIAGELARGGWAARKNPQLQYIEVNPNRLSGRPVIRDTRVPVEVVAELAAAGDWSTLTAGYGVSKPAVRDAVAWWRATQEYEDAAA